MSDDMKYTENMEKSLQQAHGVGHEVYKKSLDQKVKIEQEREKEYRKSLQTEQELSRKISR
ncbi:hypothetical protein K8O68_00925 [Salipaludibacillus sp. CUR1]|jgi:hypothetical protein|uniref:Uncharacterized protein n=1 Tax=Salipaludibacillus aurantiacus TaxID=1601833 RepID=A0A1H9VLT4_9BACI|nr:MULTISPECIES: hypothetical protein [Salipaludibacillus]MCE7790975.1 hypothetical protein [Salipaludibacillus sp. CUR1]SES22549.1 hypothetical protein SAMN05518684_11196 [Salipaludibacillus aurantiacus]